MYYFHGLKKFETFGIPNRILWDSGTEVFKIHKTRTNGILNPVGDFCGVPESFFANVGTAPHLTLRHDSFHILSYFSLFSDVVLF
jgi:hypothetical protein